MSGFWTIDAANMFCGAQPTDLSTSLHLKLVDVHIPMLEENYVEHRPGGAPVEIQVDMIYSHFECAFQIIGVDPQVFTLIRPIEDREMMFYIYGLIKDHLTLSYMQAAVTIKGRLAIIDQQRFQRGDTLHTLCVIKGITYYKFEVAGQLMWEWDFFSNYFRKGSSQNAAGVVT